MADIKIPLQTIQFNTCDFWLECNGFEKTAQYKYGHVFTNNDMEVEINYATNTAIFSQNFGAAGWVIIGFSKISIPTVANFLLSTNFL